MDEEKGQEETQTGTEETTTNTDIGLPSKEEEKIITDANDLVERKEKAAAEEKANLDREEKLMARREALIKLGGTSPAGTKPETPKEMTDTEYAEALERGEVNPLKEDGFYK